MILDLHRTEDWFKWSKIMMGLYLEHHERKLKMNDYYDKISRIYGMKMTITEDLILKIELPDEVFTLLLLKYS